MRIEEYETPPEDCTVEMRQTVWNEGVCVMDAAQIKCKSINPYLAGSVTAEATVLPYPFISTASPYFAVNDYSKLQHLEIIGKVFADKGYREAIRNAFKDLFRLDTSNTAVRVSAATWSFFSQTIKDLVYGAASGFAYGTKLGATAGMATLSPAGAAAFASLGGVLGASSYGAWQLMLATRKTLSWDFTPEEEKQMQARMVRQQGAAVLDEPKQHKISMMDLPKILRRIAETRSNGSLMRDSDNTLGLTIHDLKNMDWHREAALLEYLMWGRGEREGADPVTGLYDQVKCMEHAKAYEKN
eukprot:3257305-Prymnesium_polylepis.1